MLHDEVTDVNLIPERVPYSASKNLTINIDESKFDSQMAQGESISYPILAYLDHCKSDDGFSATIRKGRFRKTQEDRVSFNFIQKYIIDE
jgi:hypothetical protein